MTTPGSPNQPPPSQLRGPHLATAKGISLGSTLGQLRSASTKRSGAQREPAGGGKGATDVVAGDEVVGGGGGEVLSQAPGRNAP